jgi:thiaminase (transcriptional activator TenA)
MVRFIDEARAETSRLRQAIHDMPFNQELAAGTLRHDRFQHYLIQDSLYLTDYARALSALAAKAPRAATIVQFNQAASGAVLFEQAMQRDYLSVFGIDAAAMAAAEASPTCLAYTSFMLAEALTGSYESLLAAVLPCFSIYAEVGRGIAAVAATDNPFQHWIDTYASREFQGSVAAAEAAAETAAAFASPALRRRMLDLFRRSVEFEWMFWDAAYRLETWPTVGWR